MWSRYTVPRRGRLIYDQNFKAAKGRKKKLVHEIYLANAVLGRPAALRRLRHMIPRLVMHGDVLSLFSAPQGLITLINALKRQK